MMKYICKIYSFMYSKSIMLINVFIYKIVSTYTQFYKHKKVS